MWVFIKCNKVLVRTEFPKLKSGSSTEKDIVDLNMVTKIRTLEMKSRENRSSFIPLTGKVDGNLRKSSVNSRDVLVAFHKSTFYESEPCKPLSSRTQGTKPHKLDLLSSVERFIKSKEDELTAKTEEIEQKKGEVETMLARVKEAALLTGRTGQRCSNCHQKNHTVRSCVEEKCESSFLCGDLSKHPDKKMAFQEKKRAIATLETSVKKVSQEFTARQAGFSRVTSSVNKKIWLSLKRISSQVHCLPVKWSSRSLKRNIKIRFSWLSKGQIHENNRTHVFQWNPNSHLMESSFLINGAEELQQASSLLIQRRKKKSNFKWPRNCP